jgi:hypothetical protein
MSKSESTIRNEIMLALGARRNILVHRINVGKARAFDDPSRVVDFGPPPGTADIICCIDGKFVAIEVKTTIGRQRPEQKNYEAAVGNRNGIYILARSVEDVVNALTNLGLWHD